jgi:hypothetical protein
LRSDAVASARAMEGDVATGQAGAARSFCKQNMDFPAVLVFISFFSYFLVLIFSLTFPVY